MALNLRRKGSLVLSANDEMAGAESVPTFRKDVIQIADGAIRKNH